nr:Calx-beta domain-containing protein [uncultured Actinoplanes sp.]
MRYPEAHAATSGSVPFTLRGPKSVRVALTAALAGAIGLVPALFVASPAMAAPTAADDLSWTASSTTVNEGDTASLELNWTGTGTNGSTVSTALTYSTADGSANQGSDYTAVSAAPITFTGGKATLSVKALTDNSDEPSPETVSVKVYDSAAPSTVLATGTINITDIDAEPTYTFTADKTSVAEDGGPVTVTATLGAKSGKTVTIPYYTGDVSAKAGQDYGNTSGNLVFNPGDLTKTFTVAITNDDLYEGENQTFTINASPTAGVAATAAPITVTITDNDPMPKVSIGNASAVNEGSNLQFPVTAVGKAEKDITVKYTTADATTPATNHNAATAPADYTAVSAGTVTIPAGTLGPVNASVITKADNLDELAEDLTVTLSTPSSNASIDTTAVTATGVINDYGSSYPVASLTTASKKVDEGSDGSHPVTFTVQLNAASGRSQSVDWTAAANSSASATSPADFKATTGTVTFAPGELTKSFTVDVVGDKIDEYPDETFTITLATTTGSTVTTSGNAQGNITITDDDAAPTVTLADVSQAEGDYNSVALFTVKLSNPSDVNTTYDITTTDVTADSDATGAGAASNTAGVGNSDYNLAGALVTIPAGSTTGYAFVVVNGDDVYETAETATITATPNQNKTRLAKPDAVKATLTLTNDDDAPVFTILSDKGKEGDTLAAKAVVTGVAQDNGYVNVSFMGGRYEGSVAATEDDYKVPDTKSYTVYGGTKEGTYYDLGNVVLNKDEYKEPAETIIVSGTSFGGSPVVKNGVLTIEANEGGKPDEPGEPSEHYAPTIEAPYKVVGAVAVPIKGKAEAGATVELWGAPVGEDSDLKWIANTKADKDGYYWFSRWINEGYRFVTQSYEKNSKEVKVWVEQDPYFTAVSYSKGYLTLTVQGNPKGAKQAVIIQRWYDGKWVNVTGWKGYTGSNYQWKATVKAASKSYWTLRAFVAGYTPDGLLPGYSDAKKVTIK